jgi:signal transduction histidine kinase
MMIRLRNYIALVYALAITLTIIILSITTNIFSERLFVEYIKNNIENKNNEIIASLVGQYNNNTGQFNMEGIAVIGHHYIHQGYLISLEDMAGNILFSSFEKHSEEWDEVIMNISSRMSNRYQVDGSFQINQFTITLSDVDLGKVTIETFYPFFFSETEAAFLRTVNNFFLGKDIIFLLVSFAVSFFLATTIVRPILQAKEAASKIAEGEFTTRIPEKYFTKELHELAKSVNGLAKELANGEQWQKRLTSDIAHELRTPLTSLQGTIDAMIDGYMEPDETNLKSCGEEIERLHNLVADLNMLSVLERDTIALRKTTFDLSELLASIVKQFQPLIQEKNLAIHIEAVEAPFFADYNRIKQVFINIISNAVKYTDTGSITIIVKKGALHWRVSIVDTGIGIGEADLPHVFKRFYRSDISRSRGSGGAGIGLAISAVIVSAHGGNISVESENGKIGSIFHVDL